MEKFNRAVRRHHIKRLKSKRKLYWGYHRDSWGSEPKPLMAPQQLGKVVQYPQPCSCWGCGNQRKCEGLARDEQCSIATLTEELVEMVLFGYKTRS